MKDISKAGNEVLDIIYKNFCTWYVNDYGDTKPKLSGKDLEVAFLSMLVHGLEGQTTPNDEQDSEDCIQIDEDVWTKIDDLM